MAALLAVGIVLFYAAALMLLLRGESARTLLGLSALVILGLVLRVVFPDDYPAGWNEDEAKAVVQGVIALRDGPLYRQGVEGSNLFNALFQAQLVPLIGATHWTLRGYSVLCGALAVAVGFAFARALGTGLAAAFSAALLLATLPPMLLYGRIAFGGELIFHELLVLAALARVIWRDGSWSFVGLGGIALALLLYDYPVGRAIVPIPVLAVALAPRRWLRLVAVSVIGLAGWSFFVLHHLALLQTVLQRQGDPQILASPWQWLGPKLMINLRAFLEPVGRDGWLAIQAGGIHPPIVVILALLGLVTGGRRALFLALVFFFGLLPSLLSQGYQPSSHRMLMAFPLVALAAALAIDRLAPSALQLRSGASRYWLRAVLVVVLVALAAGQSVLRYFSASHWPVESRARFDWERTALVESLPPAPHPRFLVSRSIGAIFAVRALVDPDFEYLGVENWWQPQPRSVIHLFDWMSAPLQAFYLDLLGAERVRSFGRAFSAVIEPEDWAWLRQHGWRYRAECGEDRFETLVPTLFQRAISGPSLACTGTVTHSWSARWLGPAQYVRLQFSGQLEVSSPRVSAAIEGFEVFTDILVETGDRLVIRLEPEGPPVTQLSLQVGGAWVLPRWDSVEPIEPLNH